MRVHINDTLMPLLDVLIKLGIFKGRYDVVRYARLLPTGMYDMPLLREDPYIHVIISR